MIIFSKVISELLKKKAIEVTDDLNHLPVEIQISILKLLDPNDLVRASMASKRILALVGDELLWKSVAIRMTGKEPDLRLGESFQDYCIVRDRRYYLQNDISGHDEIHYSFFPTLLECQSGILNGVSKDKLAIGRVKKEIIAKIDRKDVVNVSLGSKIGWLTNDDVLLKDVFPDGDCGVFPVEKL